MSYYKKKKNYQKIQQNLQPENQFQAQELSTNSTEK